MKTALVHDWLTTFAGSEKVLSAIYDCFPSPIYTLVTRPECIENSPFAREKITSSFLQKFPFAAKKYRHYLPLFPLAIESFDVSEYDVILSSSHAVAKGILRGSHQTHICYCHTPCRYLWDLSHHYLKEAGLDKGVKRFLAQSILHYLRMWDQSTTSRIDYFIANSHVVAQRINKTYNRSAQVIYPPVDVEYFTPHFKKENFYVAASRFVPYKKMKLIVEAFEKIPHRHLYVIGDGPEWQEVAKIAPSNVTLLGHQSNEKLRSYLQRAKAFLFAAEEDFGILPVEAQACATPVIAYERGGACETVLEGKTGLFFQEQSKGDLIEAIHRFEKEESNFDYREIREHALQFSQERFKKQLHHFVRQKVQSARAHSHLSHTFS